MIKKLSNFILKKKNNEMYIDKAILEAIVNISRKDTGNILFLLSTHSYNDYVISREILSDYIQRSMQSHKQRLNSCDTTSSRVFNNIKSDFEIVPQETHMFDRLINTVFTKNRAELNELATKCLALDNVNVYVI